MAEEKRTSLKYEDIAAVNAEINMISLGKKDYAMVPERVTAFRKLFPEGFIRTEIVSINEQAVLMQAKVGYYKDDLTEVVLATGYAKEEKGKGMVNGTSHIENCETSAVGRALGMIGLGLNGGGICSAEELANAVVAQKQTEDEWQTKKAEIEAKKMAELDGKKTRKDAPAAVSKVDAVPGW